MSIFKAFQKDRKIETTPFDLSFQNVSTMNFGQLNPIGVFPVLPSDRIKIGSNILTKVEPMPAPAFTRIKQNVYAFYTANSTTWKHWNDFVTNGTAYADTYGNNSNNQKTDNLWRQPQVSATDLQLISKIANGWAIPVYLIDPSSLVTALLHAIEKYYAGQSETPIYSAWLDFKEKINGTDVSFTSHVGNVYFSLLLSKAKKISSLSYISDLFDDIPYYEFYRENDTFYLVVGCDCVTAYRLHELRNFLLGNSTGKTPNFSTPDPITVEHDFKTAYKLVAVRIFCDNVSDDVSLKKGPFILEKKSYSFDQFVNRPITYYVYHKNKYQDLTTEYSTMSRENSQYVYRNNKRRDCGYFWNSLLQRVETDASSSSAIYVPYMFNGVAFNPPVQNPNYDFMTFFSDCVDDDYNLSLHLFHHTYNEIFYNTRYIYDETIPDVGSYSSYKVTSSFDESNLHCVGACPFMLYSNFSLPSSVGNLESISIAYKQDDEQKGFQRFMKNYFDVELPLFYDQIPGPVQLYASMPQLYDISFPAFTFESWNLGYDSFSFLIYLCQNSCRLLDNMNIPLEGLTARDFVTYAGEFINVLPFMAYSKIWNDYFRNKVTSSAELDYHEINSVGSLSWSRLVTIGVARNNQISIPNWLNELYEQELPKHNGWSIPFCCAPKNATDVANITVGDNTFNLLDFNHFHDLRCCNWWILLSVLTGWQLQNVTVRSAIDFYDELTFDVWGILCDKMYLPSYYNGLFHLKYQNFNKDYFSSSLLDPASGANDEQIGDTVSSLVNAQAKQGFWNRLAQNRSVKQFWNSVFGVDPTHDDYDKPLLLGSNHTDVNVGEVVQLSQTDNTPQGQRSGLGSAHDKSGLCNKRFNEHGYIIVLCSHTLELQYMQGLEKDWTPLESFLDLPFIDFVGLGNMNIRQRELDFTAKSFLSRSNFPQSWMPVHTSYSYMAGSPSLLQSKITYQYPSCPQLVRRATGKPVDNQALRVQNNLANGSGQNFDDTFGYIPRYSTYKFKFDQCHGEFRNELDFWHSFRKFFTQPILCHEFVNWEFMSENDELGRMFFVVDDSTDKFKLDIFLNVTAYRPLPYICIPATSKG